MDLAKLKDSGRKKSNCFLVIHGETKVGKSTLASYIPDSILVCVENDGADDLDHPHKYTRIPDSKTLVKMLPALAKLPEQNIIIDNITFLDEMIKEEVLKSNGISSLSEIGHGKAYEQVETKSNKVIKQIHKLKTHHDKNVIILGHTKLMRSFDVAAEDDVSELTVSTNRPRTSEFLTRLSTGVFYFTLLKSKIDTKGKKTAGDTIVKKKDSRVIYLNKLAGVVCGSNLRGLKDKIVFRREDDYSKLWKMIGPQLKDKKRKGGKSNKASK